MTLNDQGEGLRLLIIEYGECTANRGWPKDEWVHSKVVNAAWARVIQRLSELFPPVEPMTDDLWAELNDGFCGSCETAGHFRRCADLCMWAAAEIEKGEDRGER